MRTIQRKVFIPNIPTHFDYATGERVPSIDVNPAAAYGELSIIIDEREEVESLYQALRLTREAMEHIAPSDYILAVGDIVLIAGAMLYACDRNGLVQILRWDRKMKHYNVQEVIL